MRRLLALALVAAPLPAGELEDAAADLASPDPARRARAVRVLREAGEEAVPVLEQALAHRDPEVRRHARAILTAARAEALLGELRSPDVDVRAAALERLYEAEGGAAFAFLEKHLDTSLAPVLTDVLFYEWEPARRQEAIKLLARIGHPHSLRGLVWAIRDRIGHNQTVAQILGEQGDASVLHDLHRAARAGVPGAREAFRKVWRRVRPRGQFPRVSLVDPRDFLRLAREGETPADRIRGIRATVTGLVNDDAATEVVANVLDDRDDTAASVRRWAARAFGYLGVAGREELLMRAVREDEDRIVRIEACLALGRAASEVVQAFLLGVVAAPRDAELRRAAASALGDAGDAAAAERLEALAKAEKDEETAAQLVRSAARIRARIG